jgi:hypothetical protein
MPMNNPFSNSAWDIATLTAAMDKQPHEPGRIGELGIFEERGIPTTTVILDERQGVITLVPTSPRGSPGQPMGRNSRKARSLIVPHLQRNGRLNADEVQGVRAFGTDSTTEAIDSKRNELLSDDKRNYDATHEWHRVGALKGQVLDADGTSVLFNLFTEFGVTQQTEAMALTTGTTKVRQKISSFLRKIENELGATPFRSVRAFCGNSFWDELIEHQAVKDTALNWTLARDLRSDPRETLVFGGVTWERYRGKVGSLGFIADDDAYAFPEGVPGLFITRFAPADYVETVNTPGRPYYAKGVVDPMGKGVDLETQSNPLHICTRPAAVIKLTKV